MVADRDADERVGVVAVRSLRFERNIGWVAVVGAFAWLARRKRRFQSGRREASASGACADPFLSSCFCHFDIGTGDHGTRHLHTRVHCSQSLDGIPSPIRVARSAPPHHDGPCSRTNAAASAPVALGCIGPSGISHVFVLFRHHGFSYLTSASTLASQRRCCSDLPPPP
jgi:hypothetical protein